VKLRTPPDSVPRLASDTITLFARRSTGSFGPALLGLVVLLSGGCANDDPANVLASSETTSIAAIIPATSPSTSTSTEQSSTTTTTPATTTSPPGSNTTFAPVETIVVGVVIDVAGTLAGIESFMIRLEDGSDLTLVPADGLLFDGVAPLSHVRDHMISGNPVEVTYESSPRGTLAIAIGDA